MKNEALNNLETLMTRKEEEKKEKLSKVYEILKDAKTKKSAFKKFYKYGNEKTREIVESVTGINETIRACEEIINTADIEEELTEDSEMTEVLEAIKAEHKTMSDKYIEEAEKAAADIEEAVKKIENAKAELQKLEFENAKYVSRLVGIARKINKTPGRSSIIYGTALEADETMIFGKPVSEYINKDFYGKISVVKVKAGEALGKLLP